MALDLGSVKDTIVEIRYLYLIGGRTYRTTPSERPARREPIPQGMSGRGRGRGRGGIPINYPDGLTAKQPSKSPYPDLRPPIGLQPSGGLPASLALSSEDRDVLAIRRQIQQSRSFVGFRIGPSQPPSHFERYSDRYRSVPKTPFAKSPAFCLQEGVHYFSELRSSASRSTMSKPKPGKRKRRNPENLNLGPGEDVFLSDSEEGEEGEGDGDKAGEGKSGREGEGEGGEEDEDDESEKEDDLLSEGSVGGGDFEDGGDDADSGGDDEPTY